VPEDLEIVDVQVSPPRLTEPDIERGERQEWVDIAINVRNRSAEKTLYTISSLRTLDYDPDTQTLLLGLSEPEPDPGFPQFHTFLPELASVPPGESEALQVSVPLIINRITSVSESGVSGLESELSGLNTEVIDISGLQRVSCTISYDETLFRPVTDGAPVEQQLHSWGKIVEKTIERALGPKKGEHPRKRRRQGREE